MTRQFLDVIEDNLIQLRAEAACGYNDGRDAAEAESRILSNLAVLIAAGQVENPAAYCAETLGRLDEIRLQTEWDVEFAMVDPAEVREEMGTHRFTYLHLHNGEVLAAVGMIRTTQGTKTTGIAGEGRKP